MSRPTRRGLMGGVAALIPTVAAAPALAAPEPDAALVAACTRHIEAERAFSAVCKTEPNPKAPTRPAWEVEEARTSAIRRDGVDEVLALPCTSLAGVLALAQALVACKPEVLTVTGYDDEDLAAKLVTALLALDGAA